jgi:flagellar biosynthesis chaperone FliJ
VAGEPAAPNGSAVEAPEIATTDVGAPAEVDPFAGWSEERRAEWERERAERIRKVFQRSIGPLEKATEAYEEHESLPESHLWKEDRESNQARIDRLLDEAIEALELSGLEDVRRELRELEGQVDELERRIARDREARISAPRADELNALEDAYTTSVEEYEERIAEAEAAVEERRARAEELRDRFVDELRAIGVDIDREAAESLLASVSGDDFVQLCVVFDNVRLMTEQLQELTEQSGERLDVARRYYGLYVVLIRIMDRLQRDFVDTVRTERIPKLGELAEAARENIRDAERNMRTGGDREIGLRNVEANRLTIEATRIYTEYLAEQAAEIERQNRALEVRLRDAENTYDTVRVSSQVAEILRESVRDLDALLELEVPKLRGFENRELQEEFLRLTDELGGLQ